MGQKHLCRAASCNCSTADIVSEYNYYWHSWTLMESVPGAIKLALCHVST